MNITKTVLAGLLAVSSVFALPVLQLDISDGIYDPTPGLESTVNTSNVFDLIALLDLTKTSNVENYYISMAVTPQIEIAEPIGSFKFAGETIDISKMQYGTPPADLYEGKNDDGMAPHSIFPTYFYESGFSFDPDNAALGYNVQDNGMNLTPVANGKMLFNRFAVDLTELDPNYGIHFDLYNKVQSKPKNDPVTDLDAGDFAPWSHDADVKNVPEPATLSLFGMGILALSGMGLIRRRK